MHAAWAQHWDSKIKQIRDSVINNAPVVIEGNFYPDKEWDTYLNTDSAGYSTGTFRVDKIYRGKEIINNHKFVRITRRKLLFDGFDIHYPHPHGGD